MLLTVSESLFHKETSRCRVNSELLNPKAVFVICSLKLKSLLNSNSVVGEETDKAFFRVNQLV